MDNEHEESVHTALKCSELRDGRNCIFALNAYDDNLQNSERNMRKSVSFSWGKKNDNRKALEV